MDHRPKYKMQIIKFIEDNIGENQDYLGKCDAFSYTIQNKLSMTARIDKLYFIKITTIKLYKVSIKKIRQARDLKIIFSKCTVNKGHLCKIYKE